MQIGDNMQYIDFNCPKKVHFTGIGGISMSGFAELLIKKGFTVTGSDWKETPITERLEELGAKVAYGTQKASNVPGDADLLIYTAAVKADNPELLEADRLNIPKIERADLVGDVMLHFKHNYSIAGTHGKTTTTSMLSLVILEAGLDPTISVGGILAPIGGNMRIGASDNFVVESCEYCDSFLSFHPTRAIITSIEAEHLDYFKTLENERASYKKFAGKLPADGLLVACTAIPDMEELFKDVSCKIITYNSTDTSADYYATDISYNDFGQPSFTLMNKGKALGHIDLKVMGEHNVANAVAVAAMALNSGISLDTVKAALLKYTGTGRRFEIKGSIGGVTVVDDYAHHPTEIATTLKAAARYPHKTLWTVFQPHTYSRTAAFKHDFAEALSHADKIVLTDIYAARETNTFGISSEDICDILKNEYGKDVYHFSSFDEIVTFLLQNCSTGDLLITMGAGDVVKIGETLLGK